MGKKNPSAILDNDTQKRLDKLTPTWSKKPGLSFTENLSLHDLRLLLTHFEPLQHLVREIVSLNTVKPSHHDDDDKRASAVGDEEVQDTAYSHQATLECNSLKADLQACSHTVQKLLAENKELKETLDLVNQQLCKANKQLQHTESQLASHHTSSVEVALIRNDIDLSRRLGLNPLPDHPPAALIQAVAVLSQRENIERLWEILKERCETENRSVTNAESELLSSALDWHNFNWISRPFKLVSPAPNSAFDYSQHRRCQETPTGEKIKETRLAGILDGTNKIICKPLVATC